MRYFRRRSSPALVALLALAMQASLVFAQMHVHSHVPSPAAERAWAQGVVAFACRAVVHPGCPPVVPQPDHTHDCPVCMSLAAAGTAVLPALMVPPHVAPRYVVLRPSPTAAAVAGSVTVHFQARAPPVA